MAPDLAEPADLAAAELHDVSPWPWPYAARILAAASASAWIAIIVAIRLI